MGFPHLSFNRPAGALIGVILGILPGCSDSGSNGDSALPPVDSAPLEPAVWETGDPEVDAARREAREGFEDFFEESRKLDSEGVGFLARIVYQEDGSTKESWVSNLEETATGYRGMLEDRAGAGKLGKPVEFTKDHIIDWMYVRNGIVVGAYELQLERSRMAPEERKAHDERYPFRFE